MGEWVPLMDYAMKKGVSLSTLRRHIKAGKIKYRVESGRYLLLVESASAAIAASVVPVAVSSDDFLVSQLQSKLKKAQEEIVELKTLIAFYEESLGAPQAPASSSMPYTNRFNG